MIGVAKFTSVVVTLLSVLLLQGCDHPLHIDGRGDIFSASGTRDCRLEVQPCTNLVHEAYRETYTAVARDGWHFVGWEGCPTETGTCPTRIASDCGCQE